MACILVNCHHLYFGHQNNKFRLFCPFVSGIYLTNCTSIIDCFEIFIEKPKNFRARAQTYSQYKHHNTVKYLISTPHSVLSFVSNGWGRRTSDKHKTEYCGYLEKLLLGDVILADGGFNVKDAVGLFCAQLKIPEFTKGKQQLQSLKLEATRGLVVVRIKVERVMAYSETNTPSFRPPSNCLSAKESLKDNLPSLTRWWQCAVIFVIFAHLWSQQIRQAVVAYSMKS